MVDGDGFPYRVGNQVIHEPQEVINQRKQAYRRVGYEQQVRPDATIDDLDMALAEEYLNKTPYAGRPALEILQRYGLIIPKGKTFAVTNAALLLFCKTPSLRWHPRSGVRIFRVDGTDRKHGTRRNVAQQTPLEPPLARMIPEAHKSLAAQIGKSEKLHSLFFREMPEYPTFAWQEALVNAIAHRDYNEQGREIEVWFFDDRMEIQSPGELVPPVTIAKLKNRQRVHASRNPLIVRVLVDVGIMREEGEGIPRIFEEMEESLLRQPEFSLETASFFITLRNEPVYTGHSPIWGMLIERFRLGMNQKRLLLANPGGFSNEVYRKLTGVDRDQAYREIQELVTLGILEGAPSAGRGAVYRIAPALNQQRAWLESRILKLITYFGAHDQLTNSEFCRLYGLTRFVATRELKRMVDDGYLILSGSGRGAHYLPGPMLARFLQDCAK
jgi:ATP-dependent DNA helicase RecG